MTIRARPWAAVSPRACALAIALVCLSPPGLMAESVSPSASTARIDKVRIQAEQGNAQAQYDLGAAYSRGREIKRDQREAAKWLHKAAEQGHAQAQSVLGWMYMTGRGVTQDDAEAVKWLRKAADQGNTSAQNNLGLAYVTGRGVLRDEEEARKWFRKAAESGAEDALRNLERLEQDIKKKNGPVAPPGRPKISS